MELNEKLKEKILSSIPEDYTPLEKAVYVYYTLCRTLRYSMEFYLDNEKYDPYFEDSNNLQKVDGETNKDVVCYTFNVIYILFLLELEKRGVKEIKCEDLPSYLRYDKSFNGIHQDVRFSVNGVGYSADSTYGVLDKNDLVLLKYTNSTIEGISVITANPKVEEELKKAIDKVCGNEKNMTDAISLYESQTSQEELSLDERVKLFLTLGENNPFGYSVSGLNYMLKLKNSLFTKDELEGHRSISGKYGGIDLMIEMRFIMNKKTNEYEVYLFYNPEGYTRDKGYENFDSLQVYKLSLKKRKTTKIDLEKFKEEILNDNLYTRDGAKPSPVITREGTIFTRENYVGGKAIYDSSQKAINIESIVRVLIKDNEREVKIKE